MYRYPLPDRGVTISEDYWIGTGVTVMEEGHICQRSVVASDPGRFLRSVPSTSDKKARFPCPFQEASSIIMVTFFESEDIAMTGVGTGNQFLHPMVLQRSVVRINER